MSIAADNYLWDPVWVPPYVDYIGMEGYADSEPGDNEGVVRWRDWAVAGRSAMTVSTQGIAGSNTVVAPCVEKLQRIVTEPVISATADSNRLLPILAGWRRLQIEITAGARLWMWRWMFYVGYSLIDVGASTLSNAYIPDCVSAPHELIPSRAAVASWPQNSSWDPPIVCNGTPCQAELAQDLLQRAYALAAAEIRFTPWRSAHYVPGAMTDW